MPILVSVTAMLAAFGFMPPYEAFSFAKEYAEKALSHNSQQPEAYYSLALVSFWHHWDLKDTCYKLEKTLSLNFSFSEAHQLMAMALLADGKSNEALRQIEIALQIDPLSEMNYFSKGYILAMQEKYVQSNEVFDKALLINPYFVYASIQKGFNYLMLNEFDKACTVFKKLPVALNKTTEFTEGLGVAYAMQGNLIKTQECVGLLQKKLKTQKITFAGQYIALIYTRLGNITEALFYLEKGVELKASSLIFLRIDPIWSPFQKEEKYIQLLEKIRGGIHVNDWQNTTPKRYVKSGLKEKNAQNYLERLNKYMDEHKPYLNANLSLKELAVMLKITSNQLSQILNEQLHLNFYDYVNTYRVNEFKQQIKLSQNKKYTILSLTFECGFNSKTTFNIFLKNIQAKHLRSISNKQFLCNLTPSLQDLWLKTSLV